MSLFSKLTKNNGPDKTMFPWSQKKLNGSGHHTVPRSGHVATALSSDNLVVYGGVHKGSAKKDICYIDTNTLSANHISTSGDVPSPRKHSAIVAMGNFVLLYGGEPLGPNEPWDPHFYLLNITNRQWTRIQMTGAIPSERSGHTAVAVGGMMYIWGGHQNGRYFNELLAFNTSTYPENPHWELVHNGGQEGPCGRSGHVSVVYDNRMYVFGGSDGEGRMYNDIWAFDFQSRTWAQIPAAGFIPTAREHCAAALVDDALYVIGGRDPDHQDLNDLCAFRIRSQRWYMFQNMGPSPSPRHSLTMTAVKERMFVIGGEMKVAGKTEDTGIYILDSAKIKYPPEPNAQQQQQQQFQQQQQSQQQSMSNISSSSSSLSLPDPDMITSTSSSMQQQQQPAVRGHTPSPSQAPTPSQSTPTRMGPPVSTPPPPQHQQVPPPPMNNAPPPPMNSAPPPHHHQYHQYENGYPDTSNPHPSSSSPIPGTAATNKAPTTTPPRPPRHVSIVPEAALRRPRTASPLPNSEDMGLMNATTNDSAHDLTANDTLAPRPYPSTSSQHVMQDENGIDPYMTSNTPVPQTLPPHQQQSGGRTTPGVMSPPPRPSREGVKLNQTYQNTVMEGNNASSPAMPATRQPQPRYDPSTSTFAQRAMTASPQKANTPPSQSPSSISSPATTPTPHQRGMTPEVESSAPQHSPEPIHTSSPAEHQQKQPTVDPNATERATLMREIKARDLIISEMKKKEQWWRTEVSLARKQQQQRPRATTNNDEDDDTNGEDEQMLMALGDLEHDKLKLFEQLVMVKSELRRVRTSITQQAQPMSDKVATAERMRTAALQEAMYFKSKYLALKSQLEPDHGHNKDNDDDDDRVNDLEKRLVLALTENEKVTKQLQQWQRRAQHDHTAKQSAETRAKEAHLRAEEAQQAYERGLEELDGWHTRAGRAEQLCRESQAKVVDLTAQLSQALQAVARSAASTPTDDQEAQLKIAHLEAMHLKARNDAATYQQQLAEAGDDMARLKGLVAERDEALQEAQAQLDDAEMQLAMLREALQQQRYHHHHQPNGLHG